MDDLNALLNSLDPSDPSIGVHQRLIRQSKPYSLQDVTSPEGSNFRSSPTYVHPDSQLRKFPMELTASGIVYKKAPNTLFTGPGDNTSNTVAHEAGHMQQNRNPGLEERPVPPEIQRQILGKAMNLAALGVDEMQKTGKAKNYALNIHTSMRELGAGLAGLEADMPAGKTIWDHPEVKNLFTEEERPHIERFMRSAYDKMTPLPSATVHSKAVDWVKLIQDNIRQWTAK